MRILFLLLVVASTANAQSDTAGRWRTLDAGSHAILPFDDLRRIFLDVRDSLSIFATAERPGDSGAEYVFHSTDGGITWASTPQGLVAHGYRRISDTVWITEDGLITYDAGSTWKRIELPSGDSTTIAAIRAVGAAPSFIAIQVNHFYVDRFGIISFVEPLRLAFSTDAGSSWTYADSLRSDILPSGSIRSVLHDTTLFGAFPRIDPSSDVFDWRVNGLWIFDSSHLIVVAHSSRGNNHDYFVGHLDLIAHTARWHHFQGGRFGMITVLGSTEFYSSSVTGMRQEYWRSRDGGVHWDSIALPPWVENGGIRFLGQGFGLGDNSITRDSGRTWSRWGSPFGRRVETADLTHFYTAGDHSFFARSSDTGRTWSHSYGSANVFDIVVHGARVVVARDYRSLLVSVDSGESWRDVGLDGGLPADLNAVRALHFPDPAGAPDEIVGVATFIPYDSIGYVATIESTDGGLTWRTGHRLLEREGLARIARGDAGIEIHMASARDARGTTLFVAVDTMLFVRDPDGLWHRRPSMAGAITLLKLTSVRNGIAEVDGVLYSTMDGAESWNQVGSARVNRGELAAMVVQDSSTWRALYLANSDQAAPHTLTTADAGEHWDSVASGLPRATIGRGIWLDTAALYVLSDKGVVYWSQDGGRTFVTVHDVDTRLLYYARWTTPPIGSDGRYLYIIGAEDTMRRFRMFEGATVGVPAMMVLPRWLDLF